MEPYLIGIACLDAHGIGTGGIRCIGGQAHRQHQGKAGGDEAADEVDVADALGGDQIEDTGVGAVACVIEEFRGKAGGEVGEYPTEILLVDRALDGGHTQPVAARRQTV